MFSGLVLAVLVALPAVKPAPGGMAATVANAERIPFPALKGTLVLRVDAWRGVLELDAPRDASRLAKHLTQRQGGLCPEVEERPGGVWLHCRTRQLQARLTRDQAGQYSLDLLELRGVPSAWGDDGPPRVFYDPVQLGLGGPCPGTLPAVRGECALAAGRPVEAARHFREALATFPTFAGMRLGDLALAGGEPGLAQAWYQRARAMGIFGRLAIARECELTGSCFKRPDSAYDSTGLPEPLRTELELRYVRTLFLLGKTVQATQRLTDRLGQSSRPSACGLALSLCQSLALAVLREPGPDGTGAALALYLALSERDRGARAVEMARAAAELAQSAGAPSFGASLLAATASQVAPPSLADHLARAAELYLAANDPIRAAVIIEYADSRLSQRHLTGARWKAIVGAMTAIEARKNPEQLKKIDPPAELAQAAQALTRARSLRATEVR